MAAIVYGLCALTAFVCAWLLLRAYVQSRLRLLLWGGISFVGFTLCNLVLVADKILVPQIDLSTLRYSITLISMSVLFYGLVWDSE